MAHRPGTRLFLLAVFLNYTIALPTGSGNSPSAEHDLKLTHIQLTPRQCVQNEQGTFDCDDVMPDLTQIRDRMQNIKDEGMATFWNFAIFYTRWGDFAPGEYEQVARDIKAWLFRSCLSEHTAWNALSIKWHSAQVEHMNTNSAAMDVLNAAEEMGYCYFQGLAVLVLIPDVFLFIPDCVTWAETCAWEEYEMWPLTWNPYGQRIWRMDPRGDPGGQKLIWTRDSAVTTTQNI